MWGGANAALGTKRSQTKGLKGWVQEGTVGRQRRSANSQNAREKSFRNMLWKIGVKKLQKLVRTKGS